MPSTQTMDRPLRKTTMQHSDLVCVKRIKGKGRGVFARAAIRKGTVIEQVPVLVVPIKDFVGGLDNPTLRKYLYIWNKGTIAISLGYGSLYNHSYAPNADYEHAAQAMIYRAVRHIEPGEEITINYNGDPADQAPVGFEVK